MQITLRQLRYLLALSECRHFGHAASRVGVSQPALSVQIKALEDALGVQLIERGAREIVVTPSGREIVRRAERIMAEVRDLCDAARWERGLGGRLRLGLIPTIAPYLLPAALPLLRSRNLTLDLGVREATTADLLQELRDGELDAVVVAMPIDEPDLAGVPLFEDRFLLAGTGRLIEAQGGDLDHPGDIDPERLLLLDDGHCLADQALAACSLQRDETRMDLRASSLATLCRLAEEGLGLTFIPELAVRAETGSAPGLVLRRFLEPEPQRVIGLVRRSLSVDDGWFSDLARVLTQAAGGELSHAMGAYPRDAGQIQHDKPLTLQ